MRRCRRFTRRRSLETALIPEQITPEGPLRSGEGDVMDEPSKRVKRALRELARRGYEIELGRELAGLQGEFARWQRWEISALDLEQAIHRFHQGPARDLYLAYS